MSAFQSLEQRRLFSGGVDPSFGSTNGATFDAPGDAPVILDTASDAYGRLLLAGQTGPDISDAGSIALLARLDADGNPDASFGAAGFIAGTPRGINSISEVLALRGGGYVVVGKTGGTQAGPPAAFRLIRFNSQGKIDTSFGRNGLTQLEDFNASQLLEQPDGKLVLVGTRVSRADDAADGDLSNVAVRVSANGRIDETYGDGGWADLGLNTHVAGSFIDATAITSASLDVSGRLLVSLTNTQTTRNVNSDITSLATSTYLRRLNGVGRPDKKFVGVTLSKDSNSSSDDRVAIYDTVAVTRSDGQIAVLKRDRDKPDFPFTVSLRGANAQLKQGRAPETGIITNQLFVVGDLTDGALTEVGGNQLILAGTVVDQSVRTPALLRLNADLSTDFSFGTNGILRLPTAGGANQAGDVHLNPDGTLNAVTVQRNLVSQPLDHSRFVRVFQDDRPVASLRGASRKGGQIRVTVSVRGVDPIDIANLGSDDFRIRAVGPGGSAVPSLLSRTDAGNGDALITIAANRPRGTYDVVTLSKAVNDDDGDLVRAGTIGTITI